MTPQWDFDFIDRAPSRRKRGPILALLAVALLAVLWWQQQRNAEAQAMQVAVARAQQHLREAQLKAQANAQAAHSRGFDTSAWDVAWLDERLRELETCVPGSGVVHQWQYTAVPRGARVSIKGVPRRGLDKLMECMNTNGHHAWRLLSMNEMPEGPELELTAQGLR